MKTNIIDLQLAGEIYRSSKNLQMSQEIAAKVLSLFNDYYPLNRQKRLRIDSQLILKYPDFLRTTQK